MDSSLACTACGRNLVERSLHGPAASFCDSRCRNAWLDEKPAPQRVVASVVLALNTEGRVALASRRKNPNLWGLTGGMIEAGERPIDAALRELNEEVGLSVTHVEPIYAHARPDGPGDVHFFVALGLDPSPLQPGPGEPPARWAPVETLWSERSSFPELYRRVWVAYERWARLSARAKRG